MQPLFSVQQSRGLDDYAINKLNYPSLLLMENAANSIFTKIVKYNPELGPSDRIGIICGKGNNAGDGFALARICVAKGVAVQLLCLYDESELSPDSFTNFNILKALESKILNIKRFTSVKDLSIFKDCTIIVDAILGTGAQGPLVEPLKSIVEKLNSMEAFKVAADVPTGLNADTGFGDTVFEADLTVSLGTLKRGLFIGRGYEYAGIVELGFIGVDYDWVSYRFTDFLIEKHDIPYIFPVKKKTVNKYSAGKVLTIGGSGRYVGAAEFTAFSAMKVGAGASVLAVPASVKNNFNRFPELVLQPYPDNDYPWLSADAVDSLEKSIEWADVIAVGPGLGREEDTIEAVVYLLSKFTSKVFVIDADALFALSKAGVKKLMLKNSILTPHPGEFELLSGVPLSELEQDLLRAGRQFTKSFGPCLVLKNPKTIMFTPSGEAFVNNVGNQGLAKFGSGDVLTGIIAGVAAQKTNPRFANMDLGVAVLASIYLHGFAGDLLREKSTEYGFTATDIIKILPKAIKKLVKE